MKCNCLYIIVFKPYFRIYLNLPFESWFYRQNHMLKPLWRLRHQNHSILEIFRKQLWRQSSLKGKYNWWKKHLPIVLQSRQLAFTWPPVEVGTLNPFGPDFASFFTEMNKLHQEPFVRLWREDRSRTALMLFMMMCKENLVQKLVSQSEFVALVYFSWKTD